MSTQDNDDSVSARSCSLWPMFPPASDEDRNKRPRRVLMIRWLGMNRIDKFEPVAKATHIGRDGFCRHACGCRVRGGKRICKHYYANQRSALTESALGTDSGDGGTERGKDPDLVHPGIPQPAPTFFSENYCGKPWRFITDRSVGVSYEHTKHIQRDYRYYLKRFRRAERRRNV